MELISGENLVSLATLSALEVVLGIDNIIFISILAGRLPIEQRDKARKWGLGGALITRLALLSLVSFLAALTTPWFSFGSVELSGKSLILIVGGLFLLYKSTKEIHHKLEGEDISEQDVSQQKKSLSGVIVQVMLLDIVFSIDSVITAVGMTQHLWIMVLANVIALGVMLAASKSIADFVEQHPSVKVLALSFLLMIGLVLIAEGFGVHIPKGYVYFAMGFSVFVEMVNIRVSKRSKPVHLKKTL
jgi:predicted tellurium resistance membrane protein TerC